MRFLLKTMLLVLFATYGLLYMSYKYAQPELGNRDFFRYQVMIDSPLNLNATKAPFVLRQLPTLVARAIKSAGIYYPNDIAFSNSERYSSNSQRNLFSLILSNYLAFALSLIIIAVYLKKKQPEKTDDDILFPIIALACGYFMVPLNVIAPLTEGYAWLSLALLTIGLIERNLRVSAIAVLIAAFSRETVLIFFCVYTISLIFINRKDKGFLQYAIVVVASIVFAFGALMLIRINYTHGFEGQLSISHLLSKTTESLQTKEYLFQAILTQGLLAILLFRLFRKDKKLATIYMCTIVCIIAIGGFGVGRIIGESFVFVMLLLMIEDKARQRLSASDKNQ